MFTAAEPEEVALLVFYHKLNVMLVDNQIKT